MTSNVPENQTHKRLLLVGATGLVGKEVIRQALSNPQVVSVVAPVRRPLTVYPSLNAHPKLHAPIVDFDQLSGQEGWWEADAVICTLGTTMRKAASREALFKVDHDYPLAVAHFARLYGTPTYALNSAVGADPDSRFFYNRTKGKVEHALQGVGFESLTFVRPGLIGGQRDEFRFGERLATVLLKVTGPILPRRWRINPAEKIAGALLDAALRAPPGVHIVDSAELA
ncbi:NAD(P)H-binding protein [Microbulbifer sp. CAU 1566]|uniref:NAD(P)H-binding protein n=1 Tax=Microbulbifer sp. CAU 1566 TaxID=2933269 RepID=UPI002006227F|nr:NAD(P)H-binding protein [Microbulbifer sp. CAU 1566]MCK7596770.1 NAD(P)H-binding protein [Microbulbifer sp. CAU 1566]